jgi:hypothetical protein
MIALIVVGLLAVLIAVVVILALTEPATFRVERTTSIKVPPGEDLPDYQRLPELERMVALREKGPRDEADLQRAPQRQGRHL